MARRDPAGSQAQGLGPAGGGHGQAFRRGDPGVEVRDAAAPHDRRHLHLVEHGVAVTGVAAVRAQGHGDAPVQHLANTRDAAPELGVAARIVDHRGLLFREDVELSVGEVHRMCQGGLGAEQAEPRCAFHRGFTGGGALHGLHPGLQEVGVHEQVSLLGHGQAPAQEVVRAGVRRAGRHRALDGCRSVGDEVQRLAQPPELLAGRGGRLLRRDHAPPAHVGHRGRDERANPDARGRVDARADLLQIDGPAPREVMQHGGGAVLEVFQQGDVVRRQQVVVARVQDVLDAAPFREPQLEGHPVPEAPL